MSRQRPSVRNYIQALNFLGDKETRKLCNNTTLHKYRDGTLAIQLHWTDVISFKPNRDTVFDTGGWRSVTTKDRINEFSEYSVYSKKGEWVVRSKDETEYLFERGMVIKADGSISTCPYYAITLGNISGQECKSKEDMLSIIKELDKKTIAKFLNRITIDFSPVSVLCLTRITDKDTFQESIEALTLEQLWKIWKRASYDLRKQIEPRLADLIYEQTFQVLLSMWEHCRNVGRYFIAENCPKEFLPLTLNYHGPFRYIVESRLKED
jgi:hypothetical protein